MSREFWLEGPIEGVPPELGPVAHALLQAGDDLRPALSSLTPEQVWHRPNGAASTGFHLRHLAGSLDRLVTYSQGKPLSDEQRASLAAEKTEPSPLIAVDVLLDLVDARIQSALAVLRATPVSTLLATRLVGRAQRPSTVLGLLAHAADHSQRHTGQAITTARIVRGQ
jgi:uncharacterized damage-inducible protein DinB